MTQHNEPAAETGQPAASVPPYSSTDPLVSVNRSSVSMALVGLSLFVVGVLVGFLAFDRFAANNRAENEALLSAAAATFAAAIPAGAQQVAASPTRDPNARYDVLPADNPSKGPVDAPVTIIEFGDFRCGFCKRFFDDTLSPLLAQYGDQVRFVYRDYPILGPDSLEAALAAECADDQGRFWEFHDLLYADQVLTREAFLAHATALELDVATFTTCLESRTHEGEITEDYLAGSAVGVGGTPTFFINGRILVGAQPQAQFAAAIDRALAEAFESTEATS